MYRYAALLLLLPHYYFYFFIIDGIRYDIRVQQEQ